MEINYAKLSEQELIEYANAVLVSDEVIGGSLLPRCAVTVFSQFQFYLTLI